MTAPLPDFGCGYLTPAEFAVRCVAEDEYETLDPMTESANRKYGKARIRFEVGVNR
jgi:hypothetical protein